jgi:uncharacterized protein
MWPFNRRARAEESAIAATDGGLENLLTAMGTSYDKSRHSHYRNVLNFTLPEADNVYRGSWLARKINNTMADEMFREWLTFSWDGSGDHPDDVTRVKDAITRYQLRWQGRSCKRWARLYGGSSIVTGVGDEDLSRPLDVTKITRGSLRWLKCFDRYRLVALPMPLTSDPSSPNYGLPNFYQLMQPDGSTVQGDTAGLVHWTRVTRMDGEEVPWYKFRQNGFWHDSTLLSIVDELKGYDTATGAIATMLFDCNVDIMKSKDLIKQLGMNGGATLVQQRYATGAQLKSLYRMLVIDKDNEDYDRKAYTFGGLADVIREFRINVAAASETSLTRLFGTSATGLNATGQGDQNNDYDVVAAKQEAELRRPLTALIEMIIRSELGVLPTGLTIEFVPLWQMSESQKAAVELQRAQARQIYFGMGAIGAELVAKQLHEENTFSQMENADVTMAAELDAQPRQTPQQAAALLGPSGRRPPEEEPATEPVPE